MRKKRVRFGEFEIPIPRGHQQIIDRDATTDYLFIHAPKEIYTLYFDSTMPFYSDNLLNGYEQGSTLELKMPDRRIVFFCPYRSGNRKNALLYFNIEFSIQENEILILPGQVVINSDEVYRKTVDGKRPFVNILEQIKLNFSKETSSPLLSTGA